MTVDDVVLARVRRLGSKVTTMLESAAAAGPVFDAVIAADAAGIERSEMVEAISLAEQARLIRADAASRYAFCHEILRRALLSGVSDLQRARLHERLLEVLESRGAPAADLTHHATEALPLVEPCRAVHHARAAAAEAIDLSAPDATIDLLERLLERLDDGWPRERCELLLELGRLHDGDQPGRDYVFEAGDRAGATVGSIS